MATWAWRCGWPANLPEPAPFFADIAEGPPGGAAWWLRADDGTRTRWALWPGGARGTVLLFPGRSEYIEKYGRTARAFHDRGLSVAAIDWRGQGLADRTAADIGDIDHFDAYQRDVAALVAALGATGAPRPWTILGHSMGACIGLRALQEHQPFDAAVFTGPMWAIKVPRALRPVDRFVARGACVLGLGMRYVTGHAPRNYTLANQFEGNKWTSDRAAWEWLQGQLRAQPALNTGGPSWRWLAAALDEVARITRAPLPDVPVRVWLGSAETIVEIDAVRGLVARWPSATLEMVEGGRHELLMEVPAIRDRIADDTAAFIAGLAGQPGA